MNSNDLLYEEIAYADIVANWENREHWDKWKVCLRIAANIPHTEVRCSLEEKIWRFVINWQRECAIAQALNLKFYDRTHNYFHTGGGLPKPDFIDERGQTYELKNTSKYSYDDCHWWGADIHLFYNKWKGILYQQQSDSSYVPIKELKINREVKEYDKN